MVHVPELAPIIQDLEAEGIAFDHVVVQDEEKWELDDVVARVGRSISADEKATEILTELMIIAASQNNNCISVDIFRAWAARQRGVGMIENRNIIRDMIELGILLACGMQSS